MGIARLRIPVAVMPAGSLTRIAALPTAQTRIPARVMAHAIQVMIPAHAAMDGKAATAAPPTAGPNRIAITRLVMETVPGPIRARAVPTGEEPTAVGWFLGAS